MLSGFMLVLLVLCSFIAAIIVQQWRVIGRKDDQIAALRRHLQDAEGQARFWQNYYRGQRQARHHVPSYQERVKEASPQ